ncbi:MAG TPA: hypothetical protein VJS39_12240 [Gemmatimonadaceae bacterium]|nr:hypothetical protein [Gemmatimonadaceae bacterium]
MPTETRSTAGRGSKADNSISVLALGTGISLLGVLRALSRSRVDVFALREVDRVTRRSRWYRPVSANLAGLTPDNLAQRLEGLPPGTVLIPCADSWARAVAALPMALRAKYPASIAPIDAIELLVDKGRFGRTLERLGLPHPRTRLLTSMTDLERVPDADLEDSFLKPAHSQQFFARFGVKAYRIAGRNDAEARLKSCLDAGFHMMMQEYVRGPATSHFFVDGFVDRQGAITGLFARRRIRMSPPDFGNSTFMVSVPLGDVTAAVESLRALLADIKYRGIFSAELKRDERSGDFNLIEVNARAWWYVDFAARCGVNVCEMAIADALERPVPRANTFEVGRRCVFPYYDLEAVRTERAAGRLGVIGWAGSWLGSYQPVFRWADPMPAFLEVVTLGVERLKKVGRRR